MQLIDTHTHLYLPEFDDDRDLVVNRAIESGVVRLLLPNVDIDSVSRMLSVGNRYPGICSPMIGLHPTSVKEDFISQIDKLENLATNYKFCAIGEIGIDLYWDQSNLEDQIKAFIFKVIDTSGRKVNLSICVHNDKRITFTYSSVCTKVTQFSNRLLPLFGG